MMVSSTLLWTRALLRLAILALVSICAAEGVWAQAAPIPFACTGEAYIVQDVDAQLSRVDQSVSPFVFVAVGGPAGTEYNNMGFRRSDGFLYAVELSVNGNLQIIQIDSTGAVIGLGRPAANSLPTGPRFDAGDVSPDSSTMYINTVNQPLFELDLGSWAGPGNPLPAVTSTAISGGTGFVFDWTVNPANGLLYGGDSTDGEMAVLDPATGTRTDFAVAGLPSGTAFGGAWFNAAGRLFLYQNGGSIFEIDLAGPTLVSTRPGPGSSRNDGAACVQNNIGLAKQMTANAPSVPGTITIDFVFENFSNTEDLFNLSALDDLAAVFGAHGTDWTFTSISSVPAGFANPGFDGFSDLQLVNQMPNQGLTAGSTASITVVIDLLTLANLGMDAQFCNQVEVTGETVDGIRVGDLSTDGADPDPNGDGSPDERVPSCVRFPTTPEPPIPTLGEWGLGLFALLLLAGSLVALRRRRLDGV